MFVIALLGSSFAWHVRKFGRFTSKPISKPNRFLIVISHFDHFGLGHRSPSGAEPCVVKFLFVSLQGGTIFYALGRGLGAWYI